MLPGRTKLLTYSPAFDCLKLSSFVDCLNEYFSEGELKKNLLQLFVAVTDVSQFILAQFQILHFAFY